MRTKFTAILLRTSPEVAKWYDKEAKTQSKKTGKYISRGRFISLVLEDRMIKDK